MNDNSIVFNLLRHMSWSDTWAIMKDVLCRLGKNVSWATVEWNACICHYVKLFHSFVQVSIYLLNFCLFVLSIIESKQWDLQPLLLNACYFLSIHFLFHVFGILLLDIYLHLYLLYIPDILKFLFAFRHL